MVANQATCRIDAQRARVLCERQDGPDYLVLNAPVDGYTPIEWRLPPQTGPGWQALYLYSCRGLAGRSPK